MCWTHNKSQPLFNKCWLYVTSYTIDPKFDINNKLIIKTKLWQIKLTYKKQYSLHLGLQRYDCFLFF